MATTKENSRFNEWLFGNFSVDLDEVLDWIADNMDPDDVFSEKQLDEWARKNAYVEAPF